MNGTFHNLPKTKKIGISRCALTQKVEYLCPCALVLCIFLWEYRNNSVVRHLVSLIYLISIFDWYILTHLPNWLVHPLYMLELVLVFDFTLITSILSHATLQFTHEFPNFKKKKKTLVIRGWGRKCRNLQEKFYVSALNPHVTACSLGKVRARYIWKWNGHGHLTGGGYFQRQNAHRKGNDCSQSLPIYWRNE